MAAIDYRVLDAAASEPYAAMTFPAFRPLLARLGEEAVAVGACQDGPVGLALGRLEGDVAELLSVYTLASHRRRGIAGSMLKCLEAALLERGCGRIRAVFERQTAGAEGLLRGRGFGPPQARALVCRCRGRRIQKAPWLAKDLLPAAFRIFAWRDLSGAERRRLRDGQGDWYPAVLSPFREEEIVEPLNSLGLRYKGEVVGWQVNHRLAPDTIRYTQMFVRQDLQRYGLAIPLMVESIRRQLYSGQLWLDKATFVVPYEMEGMVRFVEKHMTPYVDAVNESVEATKALVGDGH